MKLVLQRLAEYNDQAATAMLNIIAAAPADLASQDVGVYFKSIDGITEHMAWAIALWLQRYASFGSYACLAGQAIISADLQALRATIKGDRAKTIAPLRETGALLSRFVAELPESEFERRVRYRSTNGQELERTLWHTIFQVLNHGTHHRGEISAILDQHGIANDFNSFVSYVS